MKLHEITDMESIESGKPVKYTKEDLADNINFYLEDWASFGDIPKDTPMLKPEDIPQDVLDFVDRNINDLDTGDSEDGFEGYRTEIFIAAMKRMKLTIPKDYD